MTGYRTLYKAEQLPVFQNRMFDTEGAARSCARGDVELVQDADTGLVLNRAFDLAVMVYDADYQNEQGHSTAFLQHLNSVAQVVQTHFARHTLIEVGCGKGLFLEQLQALGFKITGLDPTYEGTNAAVIRDYFTPETGLRAEALVLRHVLEHVSDPVACLAKLRDSIGGEGQRFTLPTGVAHDPRKGNQGGTGRFPSRAREHLGWCFRGRDLRAIDRVCGRFGRLRDQDRRGRKCLLSRRNRPVGTCAPSGAGPPTLGPNLSVMKRNFLEELQAQTHHRPNYMSRDHESI